MCESYMGLKVGDRVQITNSKSINHLTAGGLRTDGIIATIDITAEGGYEGVH